MNISSTRQSLFNILRELRDRLFGFAYYIIENSRQRYPYALEGEKLNSDNQKTILMYRIVGKRHIYEMSAEEICNNPSLITKFHPLDVRTICFIAGVEQVLVEPEQSRKTKFKQLKQRIFSK